jgi:hypothetical protein
VVQLALVAGLMEQFSPSTAAGSFVLVAVLDVAIVRFSVQ